MILKYKGVIRVWEEGGVYRLSISAFPEGATLAGADVPIGRIPEAMGMMGYALMDAVKEDDDGG